MSEYNSNLARYRAWFEACVQNDWLDAMKIMNNVHIEPGADEWVSALESLFVSRLNVTDRYDIYAKLDMVAAGYQDSSYLFDMHAFNLTLAEAYAEVLAHIARFPAKQST